MFIYQITNIFNKLTTTQVVKKKPHESKVITSNCSTSW